MSRIEVINEGSTTIIDVCRDCGNELIEGEQIPEWLEQRFGEDAVIGSTEVDHPSYDDEDFSCERCGCDLREDEDY